MEITQDYTAAVILKTAAVRSRKWSFTLNNFTHAELTQITQGYDFCKIVFGREIGDSGTPHLQGYLEMSNAKTMTALKKLLDIDRIHLEPSFKCRTANVRYCIKGGDVIRNDFGVIYTGADLPKPDELYDWQRSILSLLNSAPDDRSIYWYYEPIGNSGKSKFGKYLAFHFPNVCLTTATKSNDILTAVADTYTAYVLDFPRTINEDKDYTPYKAIEQLKNGFITDSKLKKESRRIMFNPPHVIIFSNSPPEKSKLSLDRWKIYNIYTNTWEC